MQQREHAGPVGPLPPDWGYAILSAYASLDDRSCFHFVSSFPEFLSREPCLTALRPAYTSWKPMARAADCASPGADSDRVPP